MKLAAAISFLFLLSEEAAGAFIGTCPEQKKCIDFTAEAVASNGCYTDKSCVVKVCLELNTAKEGCIKAGDTISHVCDGADGDGTFDGNSFGCQRPDTAFEGGWTFDGPAITQCQEGLPGEDLYFILKDGNDETNDLIMYSNHTDCSPGITCEQADADMGLACGGSAPKEKLWTYTIPSDFCADNCGTDPEEPSPECTKNSDCEPDVPFHSGCGSHTCVDEKCEHMQYPVGSTCTQTPEDFPPLVGNQISCYQATCDEIGQCVDDFKEVDTTCDVVDEDLSGLDNECYEAPKCVSVGDDAPDGYPGYTECKRPYKPSDTPCSEDCIEGDYCDGEHVLFMLEDGGTVTSGTPGARGACHDGDKCGSEENEGKCMSTRKPTSYICRPSKECCDADDYCPAAPEEGRDEYECSSDDPKPADTPCGEYCPDCAGDVQEVCNGVDKLCPRNVVFQDRLCIYAGQHDHVGSVDVIIYADPVSPSQYLYSYELIFSDNLSAQLKEDEESVKVYIGSEKPEPKIGQFNHKGNHELLTGFSGSLSIEGGVYNPCEDEDGSGFHVAVHLDMANGETAWAMPCKDCEAEGQYPCVLYETEYLEEQEFCIENKKGKVVCGKSWGRYVTVKPCCLEDDQTCSDTCAAPGPAPGPSPGPDPSPTDITCSLTCDGVDKETKTCTGGSDPSIYGCTDPTAPGRRNLRSMFEI